MKVTLFKSINTTSDPHHVSLDFVLNRIKTGNQKDLISKIRSIPNKSDRNILKKQLQCILFSGTFQHRSKKGLLDHSGLLCLDFDEFKDKDEMSKFRDFATKDKYTNVLFVSPSDNGFKLIVKIPEEDHLGSFLALQDYYYKLGWKENFDISTKDTSRICYNSYDPDLFQNKNSKKFSKIKREEIISNDHSVTIKIDSNNEIIEYLTKWWDKNYGFIQGSKNNNLFILANAFSQYGISSQECESHFMSNYYVPPCKDPEEVLSIVKNAYKDTINFNTKSFEDKDKVLEIERLSHKGDSVEEISIITGVSVESIEEVIENSEKNIFWEVNKKGVVDTTMLKYKYFLENNGYFKYKSEESDEFVFVRVKNNLIENITEIDIKDFILSFLEKLDDKSIYEHFAKKHTSHFTESALTLLSNVKVNLRLDSKNVGYVYYKNCAVKVTPKETKLVDYIDLDGAVWKSHVIDRDFSITGDLSNDFRTFVYNVSKDGREDVVKSSESALGYLMHNYNDRKTQKAIILNDSKQTGSEANGGVGKGLFIQGVEQIRRTIVEDGKDFDSTGQFKYQRVGLDTQVFSFDDVPNNFNFEKLFSVITEGITIEKKNKTSVKLKYSDSPKIAITTNYVIKGKGNSHDRRKFEIEFGEHYGAHLTPADEFGHELFNDWDNDHFNRFDNYMVSLIQKYMETGLVESRSDTVKERKLIATTDSLFVDWMDSIIKQTDGFEPYIEFFNNAVIESGMTKPTFKEFSMWVDDYCLNRKYEVSTQRMKGKLNVKFVKEIEKSKILKGTNFNPDLNV